eukprot:3221209-Rhodomonas_salina.1
MKYRDFAFYNVLGAVMWTLSFLGAGFFFGLPPARTLLQYQLSVLTHRPELHQGTVRTHSTDAEICTRTLSEYLLAVLTRRSVLRQGTCRPSSTTSPSSSSASSSSPSSL